MGHRVLGTEKGPSTRAIGHFVLRPPESSRRHGLVVSCRDETEALGITRAPCEKILVFLSAEPVLDL